MLRMSVIICELLVTTAVIVVLPEEPFVLLGLSGGVVLNNTQLAGLQSLKMLGTEHLVTAGVMVVLPLLCLF